jgi:hypothetical protein
MGSGRTPRGACGLAKYDICQEPKDKERKAGLCEEHTLMWMRSEELREATQDEGVRFAMALSTKMGMREANKFKRRWMKRVVKEAC